MINSERNGQFQMLGLRIQQNSLLQYLVVKHLLICMCVFVENVSLLSWTRFLTKRIGEISLIKDLTKSMEIASLDDDELDADVNPAPPTGPVPPPPPPTPASVSASASASGAATPGVSSVSPSGRSTPLAAITAGAEQSNLEEKEKEKKKPKKGTLTKEQKAELDQYELERQKAKEERIETLRKKLIDKISVWTETDKGEAVTNAFREKMRLEAENLKMESFGIELLHAIGYTYYSKGSTLLKSQKFLGISGFLSRVKEKGTLAKDTWNTISSALDAQTTLQEMAKAEEKGGEEWTTERKAEMERTVLGKVLAAAWNGSRFEVQSVLREVCDRVLYDKSATLSKRIERAQALIIIGTVFKNAQRTPEEAAEAQVFEELVADAATHKKKKSKKDKPKDSVPVGPKV
jgi:hypothetical protein